MVEFPASLTPGSLRSLQDWLRCAEPELWLHGGRVNLLASRTVARIHEVSDAERVLVEPAALLHDIGKPAISPHILGRAGPLTADEMALVRRHAAIGANLIESVAGLPALAHSVRSHHEWWNGNGYPDRLSGAGIPLASRIIAVADAYDAMTTERPYRAPRDHAAALEALDRYAGTQFDPAIVQAFFLATSRGSETTSCVWAS